MLESKNLSENKNNCKKTVHFKCPKCQDTGYIIEGNFATPCECLKARQTEKNLKRASFNALFADKDFTNYKVVLNGHKVLKDRCIAFTKQDECKALMILGSVGCGKTHLAVATLKELAKTKIVDAVSYVELVRKLSANALDEESYYKILGKYTDVECLLIDDLFKGKVTEANAKQMYELINARYVNNRTTIVTSEHVSKKLLDIDEATASRLLQMSGKKYLLDITKLKNYRLESEY